MDVEVPQNFVDRFAKHGIRIDSLANIRFWLEIPKNGPPPNGTSFVKPEELVHTAPDYVHLTYKMTCHDRAFYRRWEYIVADGNMRWVSANEATDDMSPSNDEEELALELLRVLI